VVEVVVTPYMSVENTVVVAAAVSTKVVDNKLVLVKVTAASVSVAEA
jgi:hypothetical protein